MRNGNLIQLCSGRYYQGSGVLSHLGGDAVLLGRRALVVADAAVWPKVEARVLRSLEQSGVDTKVWLFSGHCCPGNVRSAAQAGQAYGAELVVYSHCHGEARYQDSFLGEVNGVDYRLVSADYLNFRPEKIME